jgi:hypothetical protein
MSSDNEHDIRNDNEADIRHNGDIEISTPISEQSEQSTEPISEEYICDICGRSFSSAVSLKMHKLRSHRLKSIGAPTQTLEGPIPDAMQSLEQLLRLFVSPRDAQAIITFLSPYGPDSVPKLWEALGNLNVPLNRRRMIIEAWCVSRNLTLPEPLKREIGITPMPTFTPSFGFAPETKQEDLFDKLLKWEMLKAQQQSNSNDSALTALQSQLESYKEELARLREELHKKDLELYKKDVDHLNSMVEDLKKQFESLKTQTSDFGVLVREAKDTFQTWLKEKGGPLFELIAGALGYAKVVPSKLITEEAEKAEQSLIELFEKRGWIAEG